MVHIESESWRLVVVSLQWRDDLNVGIDFIDTDHQKLAELLIELSGLLRPGEARAAALEKLDEIIEFTRQHFRLEERLMAESDYDQFEQHKQAHETLLREIVTRRQHLTGDDEGVRHEIMDYLEHWLTSHILGSDQQLGDYLKRRITAGQG
jgi:hemerythrin